MDGFLNGAIIGAIAGLFAGLFVGLLMLVIRLIMPAKPCPKCGEPLPKVSMPASIGQAFGGGRNCPECGCEVDRRGKKARD